MELPPAPLLLAPNGAGLDTRLEMASGPSIPLGAAPSKSHSERLKKRGRRPTRLPATAQTRSGRLAGFQLETPQYAGASSRMLAISITDRPCAPPPSPARGEPRAATGPWLRRQHLPMAMVKHSGKHAILRCGRSTRCVGRRQLTPTRLGFHRVASGQVSHTPPAEQGEGDEGTDAIG